MQMGYKAPLWVFLSVLLAWAADAWMEYSDVDLRIAERKAIPYYIRHGYEYPDIDIKKIMQQRGILPRMDRPQPPVQPYNTANYLKQTASPAYHRNKAWKTSAAKNMAMSNFIVPWQNLHSMKKSKWGNSQDAKLKMKHWF